MSAIRKPDAAQRVALLARPGPACERLRAALLGGGSELVLEADPTTIDVAVLAAVAPQAVVVVLDAAVEGVLDGFDAVLSDPATDVLYEEADLATAREGWDVARWTRHLSAKLLRHDDVLPPGREPDADPRSDIRPVQVAPPPLESPEHRDAEFPVVNDRAVIDETADATMPEFDGSGFDPVAAEYVADEAAPHERVTETIRSATATDEQMADKSEPNEPAWTPPATDAGLSREPAVAAMPETPPPAADGTGFDDLALADETAATARPAVQAAEADSEGHAHDLAAIERRIASMTLVATPESEAAAEEWIPKPEPQPQLQGDVPEPSDPPDGSAAIVRGAVLVLAGIGGPDAIRQLLGELPKGFPRPILIQQRLDGGRHDRLVQQMTRVTELPVHLAEDGAVAEAGHVYILPPALGVVSGDAGLRFRQGGDDMIAALPADDSAVLMFSGSDAGLVDAVMARAGTGAFVAGQSPDGCYDSAASAVLVARGGESGQPADLARRLVQRWAH